MHCFAKSVISRVLDHLGSQQDVSKPSVLNNGATADF